MGGLRQIFNQPLNPTGCVKNWDRLYLVILFKGSRYGFFIILICSLRFSYDVNKVFCTKINKYVEILFSTLIRNFSQKQSVFKGWALLRLLSDLPLLWLANIIA